jgi:selenide, water dikinase
MDKIALTKLSKASGCGCKIAPNVLQEILQTNIKNIFDSNLLVGNQQADDAAVYAINDIEAIISTTDFFTPIVNDPFVYGQVAAANAISDIYAMGGKPLMAIATLCWPIDTLSIEDAQQVLDGARTICNEAGITLAGGHSIDSKEPIFGLNVTGIAPIKNIKQNNGAKENDVLLITKPIGVGILSAALKREAISDDDYKVLESSITTLNSVGQALGKINGVHTMTDVTGFGLIGHLHEICIASGLGATLKYGDVPKIKECIPYLNQRMVPDATYRNWNSYKDDVKFETGVNVMEAFSLLPDPQTNGGLLIVCNPEALNEVVECLKSYKIDCTQVIGHLHKLGEKRIVIEA